MRPESLRPDSASVNGREAFSETVRIRSAGLRNAFEPGYTDRQRNDTRF